jgi:electron transfer flavoprotein-quinone oxidoreductase
MSFSQYDVIVVGAGAAGLSAAIGLARSGFSVIVVEAATYPGAENWSGCVYFCENLTHPDLLGPERVDSLAWERRLIERGFFATDGYSLLGMTYRDTPREIRNLKSEIRNLKAGIPDLKSQVKEPPESRAFRHCYTVLRPIYDHHLAQSALRHGVVILTETTVESLIREGSRVIGVCTQRGPLYADLVFLAEGDASHLVTREGYELLAGQGETPKFLQGIKQVIDMPPGAIEEIFGLGADEGAAYEMLIRNGTFRGRDLHLNMGGFVYTNRQSLSIGLVLPLDNLQQDFKGDPNLLMEWFENLPALKHWLRDGKRGVFGAKLIRGGGAKDIPQLVDDGLAIGGAASAIGIDFPYPNFTGPATGMGLLLAQGAREIREQGGDFSRENLTKYYLQPLQRTHYWQDVEFLRRWPGYVKRTETFFGLHLDLVLGTAYVWTRPKRWMPAKWINWLRLLVHVMGPRQWKMLRHEARHFLRATRLREVIDRPAWIQLILDGTLNAFRDLLGKPRPNLPSAGIIRVHHSIAGGDEPAGPASRLLQRWFRRFAPILSAAAQRVYTNDQVPLEDKLPDAIRLLVRQVNLFDVIIGIGLGITAFFTGVFLLGWNRFLKVLGMRRSGKPPRGIYEHYAQAAGKVADLAPLMKKATRAWEDRLAGLTHDSVKQSHIHLAWPQSLPEKNAVVEQGLWHVCPAHVYEARVNAMGQPQVVINFENCIKCESCWRGSDLVDWGRDGGHRFIYAVHSPAMARLVEAVQAVTTSRPALPKTSDPWKTLSRHWLELLGFERDIFNGQGTELLSQAYQLTEQLEDKLQEFDRALDKEPRFIDRARGEYLEMLARYSVQLASHLTEVLQKSPLANNPTTVQAAMYQEMMSLTGALVAKAEERARRTWKQHFSWAAADGRQMRFHHLVGIRRLLDVLDKHQTLRIPTSQSGTRILASNFSAFQPWLRAEEDAISTARLRSQWSAQLDAVFPSKSWQDRERQIPLTSEQDGLLRSLISQVPPLDSNNLGPTLHPPMRKALLGELGGRDPSLAYRVASHLWARDILQFQDPSAKEWIDKWSRADEWACLAVMKPIRNSATSHPDDNWEALLVPAMAARSLLLILPDRIIAVPVDLPGILIQSLPTLGLRGAGLADVQICRSVLPPTAKPSDSDRLGRIWSILSSADLTSIALGMADELCRRASAHAQARVQFPGLFHDEEARDTIGKFGAVKKMLAEMSARLFMIETLSHAFSPTDISASTASRMMQIKALATESLGTTPGSIAYNAGQIFGGTGYSEDDILSKFYRDAAALLSLGLANVSILRDRGGELLDTQLANEESFAKISSELEVLEHIRQRKALQAELDEILDSYSRLQVLREQWQHLPNEISAEGDDESTSAELMEAAARLDTELLATKAMLLRIHALLESGHKTHLAIARLRVWLNHISRTREDFESKIRHYPPPIRGERPIVHPATQTPVLTYADFMASANHYDSGDFLIKPADPAQPRLVPELVEADPVLAGQNEGIKGLVGRYFSGPRQIDGSPSSVDMRFRNYERYIEYRHRPDLEDLNFCRENGFFRMLIPKEQGGEGRPKIDYYFLTTHAQRLADFAISLTIQVNTSLGTTPVLLAWTRDLPKAIRELEAFNTDWQERKEIQSLLERALKLFPFPSLPSIQEAFESIQHRLEKAVFFRIAVRTLCHQVVETWDRIGRALHERNWSGMRDPWQAALDAWREACGRAEEFHDELTRRRDACDLFLRWIANGQISAFALTEPSAGSDTARLVTRAALRSVPVEEQSNGSFLFVPLGTTEPRILLDARRMEFQDRVARYRWSASAEPAVIRFDEYDYETDQVKKRFFECEGRKVYFDDIGQLRRRDDRPWYDYWEVTGGKMWITNGRLVGVMCLYARTAEGVTGFMVDRHAEGLIVGKDESKMGQCGSPTNELSLQRLRVPRENVIGLEGRGQVNALETLNVGRAGMAMSSVAPMSGLIESCCEFARDTYGEIPSWVQWRLQRMEEDRFIAEALAYEIVGQFEHPGTDSVRMESAIAKMLTTELLLEIIAKAQEIYGPEGQTELHLIEKRQRDARVLTIYEGTNEIQRFFILKDLVAEVVPRWKTAISVPNAYLSREALDFEALRLQFRQRVESAIEFFGQQLWQNPNLQANCFLLSESAAWLKAADSTLARLAWLERTSSADRPSSKVGRLALVHCFDEVRIRLKRFDEELMHLRRGYYAPEVRAASLLLQEATQYAESEPFLQATKEPSCKPLSILVIMEPTAGKIPHPQVLDAKLLEPFLPLSESSRAALETALRIRDLNSGPVTIEVVAIGSQRSSQVLREALSLGVDRVRLLVPEADSVTFSSAAAALTAALGSSSRFDLILGGNEGSNQEESLMTLLLAAAWKIPFAGSGSQVQVTWGKNENRSNPNSLHVEDDHLDENTISRNGDIVFMDTTGKSRRSRALPAAVCIEPGLALREFSIADYLRNLNRNVDLIRWPRQVPSSPVELAEAAHVIGATDNVSEKDSQEPLKPLQPMQAAGQLLQELDLSGMESSRGSYSGRIEEVLDFPEQKENRARVMGVVAADNAGRLDRAAKLVFSAVQLFAPSMDPMIVLLTPPEEELQRVAIAQLLEHYQGELVLIATPAAELSDSVRTQWMVDGWPRGLFFSGVVIGEHWTEAAFPYLAGRERYPSSLNLRVREIKYDQSKIQLITSRARGKLQARHILELRHGETSWISLTSESKVGIGFAPVRKPIHIQRWRPNCEPFFTKREVQRLLDEVKAAVGITRLADGDFIVDVGFGVGNRDGYETVIEPLEQALRKLRVGNLVIGGSRKVTEELHLLPADRQIGQSGVSVNPRILLAVGVSGAPQHLNYIGPKAMIIAFNRDPEAPIMTLNRRQAQPRVFPVVGDLFETVPAFIAALCQESNSRLQSG